LAIEDSGNSNAVLPTPETAILQESTMVLIGLIVHLTAAVFLALHVVGSHRSLYWLPLLLLVPLLASIVYFLAVCLPELRFERRVRQLVAAAAKPPVPPTPHEARPTTHQLALRNYTDVPSLENRLRLAEALLADGAISEALRHYDDCLAGPFGDDATVRAGAARASAIIGRPLRVRDRRVAGNRPAGCLAQA
jgi:hypothetical protein